MVTISQSVNVKGTVLKIVRIKGMYTIADCSANTIAITTMSQPFEKKPSVKRERVSDLQFHALNH